MRVTVTQQSRQRNPVSTELPHVNGYVSDGIQPKGNPNATRTVAAVDGVVGAVASPSASGVDGSSSRLAFSFFFFVFSFLVFVSFLVLLERQRNGYRTGWF